MKRTLFIALSFLLALSACNKGDAYEDDGVVYGKRKVSFWARSPKGTTWQPSDVIGVYSTDEGNSKFSISSLPDEGKEKLAWFSGPLSAGTTIKGAYYPYSPSAGNDPARVTLAVPAQTTYGVGLARFDVASYQKDNEVPLVLQKKLATLTLTFTNVENAWAQNEPIQAISFKGVRAMVGGFAADVTNPDAALVPVQASDELKVDMRKTLLTPSLTVQASMAPTWKQGDEIEVTVNRYMSPGDEIGDFKKVTVTVAEDAKEGEELALVVNAPDLDPVLPHLSLEWASPLLGLDSGSASSEIRGNYPAVDNNGNVYVQLARGSDRLYKLNGEDGSLAWSRELGYTLDNNGSPSCEPDGSVIYAIGGTQGSGRVVAVNGADGSVKWTFGPDKFFGNGNTPAPNINPVTVAIGTDNIYIGNAGTTGSVLSVRKSDGQRLCYVSNDAEGAGGPAGGVMSGVGLTASGQVTWLCNNGLFTAEKSLMDAPTQTHPTYGNYTPWAQRITHGWGSGYNSSRGGVACGKLNGKDAVWAMVMEKTTTEKYNVRIIGSVISPASVRVQSKPEVDISIQDVTNQDQGGIAIGDRGELIVSLKGSPASVVAYYPNKSGAWSFTLPENTKDVVGTCAVDSRGCVHIVADIALAETHNYFIVRPDYSTGTCKVVASANLAQMLNEAGIDMGTDNNFRCWTSPVIGTDGRVYISATQMQENGSSWTNCKVRVLCLKYTGVTGASALSPWPQRGADCHHTGRQR